MPCARHLSPATFCSWKATTHIAGVIKYLTQSTWSHAALYVGPIGDRVSAEGEPLVLVEAKSASASWRRRCRNTRAFTRVSAVRSASSKMTARRVCAYAAERIGFDYDVKNILDLLRYCCLCRCRSAGAGA